MALTIQDMVFIRENYKKYTNEEISKIRGADVGEIIRFKNKGNLRRKWRMKNKFGKLV